MKVLLAPTEDFIKRERTALTADAVAGATVITVANATAYAAYSYLVLGYEGDLQSEIVQVVSIGGNNITIGATLFPHKADDPVVEYRYNQRKFYGSLTQSGSYSELTSSGSPKNITVNDPQGTILEYSGNEGYLYFRATYYNSHTSEESNQLDANTVNGDESLRYCALYDIRQQAGLTQNSFITDGTVENYRKQAENEIDSYLNAQYILPLINSLGVNEVPFLVTRCAILLAAGYFDYKEFGKDGEGVKWLGEARGILKKLQTAGGQQLLGSDKKQMQTNPNSTGIQSYPNTADNNNGPTRVFTMQQRF